MIIFFRPSYCYYSQTFPNELSKSHLLVNILNNISYKRIIILSSRKRIRVDKIAIQMRASLEGILRWEGNIASEVNCSKRIETRFLYQERSLLILLFWRGWLIKIYKYSTHRLICKGLAEDLLILRDAPAKDHLFFEMKKN